MPVESWPGPAAAVRLVAAAVAEGVTPGAVFVAGRGAAGPCDVHVFGHTRSGPEAPYISEHTIFDLASLTKVVATTPAVLRLVDASELALDDPVARFLPEYAQGAKAQVTLRQLLSHSAGLPPERAFYRLPGTPQDRLAMFVAEPLVAEPGTVVCYSDIGFILLGQVVAAVTGVGLERAARELVFDPLGLAETGYLPDAPPERYAATEPRPETGEPELGVVHDENAAALGGVAGHAGVFGTVGDLVRFLRSCWVDQGCTFLSERVREAAVSCWTDGLGGRRGLGWTLAGDRWDHMTAAWPRTRAGHTGFTGTSLAFDPAGGLWTVLLTNAVHHGRDHTGIALLRRTVHAAVAAWSEGVDSGGDSSLDSGTGYHRAVRIQGD